MRKQAEGNNTYSVKDWTYNNVGLKKSESLPHFASSTARSSATSVSQLYTTYAYDALQRAVTVANSVGTTSKAYDRWTVQATDPNGNLKDYTKDALGNLTTVAEYTATSSATTTYAWDLNKSLTKITDASGNVRNFTYDGLGRRLTAEDLHAVANRYRIATKSGGRLPVGRPVCRRHLRSAFGAKRTLSGRQNRLNWSKMTRTRHR